MSNRVLSVLIVMAVMAGTIIGLTVKLILVVNQVVKQTTTITLLEIERDAYRDEVQMLVALQRVVNTMHEKQIEKAKLSAKIEVLETLLAPAIAEYSDWQDKDSWHFEYINGEWVKTPLKEYLVAQDERKLQELLAQARPEVSNIEPDQQYVRFSIIEGVSYQPKLYNDDVWDKFKTESNLGLRVQSLVPLRYWKEAVDREEKYTGPMPIYVSGNYPY